MKPVVDAKRCFASAKVCTAIKCCPVKAVSYMEVDEPILDKTLKCNCSDPNRTGKIPVPCGDGGCGDGGCSDDLYSCGGTPYGRIIIDYDKCTKCGLCAKECCGSAIEMLDDDFDVKSKSTPSNGEWMAKMYDMCRSMFSGSPNENSAEKTAKMKKMLAMCSSMCGGMSQQEMVKMCMAMYAGFSAADSEEKEPGSSCGCKDGCC